MTTEQKTLELLKEIKKAGFSDGIKLHENYAGEQLEKRIDELIEEIESPDLTGFVSAFSLHQAHGESYEYFKERVRKPIDADFKDHCERDSRIK